MKLIKCAYCNNLAFKIDCFHPWEKDYTMCIHHYNEYLSKLDKLMEEHNANTK